MIEYAIMHRKITLWIGKSHKFWPITLPENGKIVVILTNLTTQG